MNQDRWGEIFNHLRNHCIEINKGGFRNLTCVSLQEVVHVDALKKLKAKGIVASAWLVAKHRDEEVNWYKQLITLSAAEQAENPGSAAIYNILAARIEMSLRVMNQGGITDGTEGEHPHAEDPSSSKESGSILPQD